MHLCMWCTFAWVRVVTFRGVAAVGGKWSKIVIITYCLSLTHVHFCLTLCPLSHARCDRQQARQKTYQRSHWHIERTHTTLLNVKLSPSMSDNITTWATCILKIVFDSHGNSAIVPRFDAIVLHISDNTFTTTFYPLSSYRSKIITPSTVIS